MILWTKIKPSSNYQPYSLWYKPYTWKLITKLCTFLQLCHIYIIMPFNLQPLIFHDHGIVCLQIWTNPCNILRGKNKWHTVQNQIRVWSASALSAKTLLTAFRSKVNNYHTLYSILHWALEWTSLPQEASRTLKQEKHHSSYRRFSEYPGGSPVLSYMYIFGSVHLGYFDLGTRHYDLCCHW